jgi:hypothetical protein
MNNMNFYFYKQNSCILQLLQSKYLTMAFVECYKKHYIVYSLLIGLLIAAAVVVPTTVVLVKDKHHKHSSSHLDTNVQDRPIIIPQNISSTTLSITNDLTNLSSWNIVKYVYGKNNWQSVDNETASVLYPAQSANPSSDSPRGGFNFYLAPKEAFPAEEVYLSYKVKFITNNVLNRRMLSDEFDWVKGGMLPGLWIGKMGAQDSNHMDDGASCRVMWREYGLAEAYLYVNQQEPEFYKLPGYLNSKPYGESMYRGFAKFVSGDWVNVVLRIKLNTVGQNDGILQISINNRTLTYDKMNWRNNDAVKITGVLMHSFFGGSGDSWATPKEQKVLFSKFTVYA